MTTDRAISTLIRYGIKKGLITEEDRAYAQGRILETMELTGYDDENVEEDIPLNKSLSTLCEDALERGVISERGVVYFDLFDTKLMGALMPRPSEVNSKFYSIYSESPEKATDYFYSLAIDSNYIRKDRIERDLKWKVDSEYGMIDITVNLSKPEKDPKAIAAAKLLPQTGYPKCLLCHENEGYAGSLSSPARQNLRQIPFDMAGSLWYLQYSPYVYYNEHCIALCGEHTPMKIDSDTFKKLLGFVERFPHYFIGSNADLPIVGGSILSHDHMQGGRYSFAMENAADEKELKFKGYSDVKATRIKWPMSVIRLSGADKDRISELATAILNTWRGYTDEEAMIFANTHGDPHNTITPIARRRGELFELDLVLRNNLTTTEHPLGLYHPHEEHHNIKKENIGLIEVMGLAVLPARLKSELSLLASLIVEGRDPSELPETEKHRDWFYAFKDNYSFTEDNALEILKTEVGKTFVRVLSDAGVYKRTDEGFKAYDRFIDCVNAGL